MFKKVFFGALVLLGLVFFLMASEHSEDISAQLDQADAYVGTGDYQQAKLIYQNIITDYPGTDYALEAQEGLVMLYIIWGKQPQAETAFEELIVRFSEHPDITKAVNEIVEEYLVLRKYEKANEFFQYVLENWPNAEHAIWSQMGLAISNLGLGDEPNAQVAIDQLLAEFSGHPDIAKAVSDIADQYFWKLEKYEKANQLYQYVIENWPGNEDAIWSQRGVGMSNVAFSNEAGVRAAIEKLLTEFSAHPDIVQAIYEVGDAYFSFEQYEEAKELYQYVIDNGDNWSGGEDAIWPQLAVAVANVVLGNEAAAEAAIDKLLSDFAGHEYIADAVWTIADYYHNLQKHKKANEFFQYVLDNWPDDEQAMWSQAGLVRSNIGLGVDSNAQEAIEVLLADFNDHPDLVGALFDIADEYYNKALNPNTKNDPNLPVPKAEDCFQKALVVLKLIIEELPKSNSTLTTQAYHLSAECYRRLEQYLKAIEYYQIVVDNWPDYEYAWWAQYNIGRCYQEMKVDGTISESEADQQTHFAYQQLLEKYPDCQRAQEAKAWLAKHVIEQV